MTGTSRLVVAAMAALCIVLPGVSAIAQDEADLFIEGLEAYQRGEYSLAADVLGEFVVDHPDWESAWFYLGASQFQLVYLNLAGPMDESARDYGPARKSLETALKLAPSRPGTCMMLGRIAEAEGNLEDAKQLYRQELAVKALKDKNAVHVALARISYKQGNYADAHSLLRKVLLEEPYYVEARYYLGRAQIGLKQYKEAIETLKYGLQTLEHWRDKVFHLLRIQYERTDPDDPQRASTVVENWDELRNELWELRKTKARPRTDTDRETLEEVSQTYFRAQEFALDLHMWPELNKALGDAHEGIEDWAAMRNAYRHAMRPNEGEGSEDDADAWARIGRAYYLEGMHVFAKKGLLLSAITQFYAAEGDKLPPPTTGAQGQQGAAGQQGGRQSRTQGAATSQSQDPKDRLDGYARALYVSGIAKDATLDEMQAPPEPDPLVARIFDGLGEVYLYEAATYATDEDRGIISHTYEEAIETFDKALLYCPTYTPAILHKAQAWLGLADRTASQADKIDAYGVARDLLEQDALALAPNDAQIWAELGRAHLGLDELDEADQAADKAMRLDKDNASALNTAGLVKYYRGKSVAAVNDFYRAIEMAPDDHTAYINLGNALYAIQSWSRAEREYTRALDLLPVSSVANTSSQRPYVLYLIARTRHERKSYEQAIEILKEALVLRTDFCDAYRLLAASYSGLEQWRAAEEALQSALETAPKDDPLTLGHIHAHLGQVYEIQGRFHEAAAQYRIGCARDPNNVAAKYGLQRLLAQEKRGAVAGGES